jgi:hypothetical protein
VACLHGIKPGLEGQVRVIELQVRKTGEVTKSSDVVQPVLCLYDDRRTGTCWKEATKPWEQEALGVD